jgi:hypothetical protein
MQKPSLARMVLVVGDAAKHNGADVAPAVITHIWGEHADGKAWTVNLMLFPDAGEPRSATSVYLYETEEEARKRNPSTAAYWPPRV